MQIFRCLPAVSGIHVRPCGASESDDYMKRLFPVAVLLYLLFSGAAVPQWNSPVLLVHPRQLALGGNALQGLRVKMEVAFFYRSIVQEDSLFQKCTVEGKFRESGNIEDEVVLYNVLIPNAMFILHYDLMKEGSRLTISGLVRKAHGPWTRIEVFELSPGWETDSSTVAEERSREIPFMNLFLPDSTGPGVKSPPDSSRKTSGGRLAGRKPDSTLRKSKKDSTWVK